MLPMYMSKSACYSSLVEEVLVLSEHDPEEDVFGDRAIVEGTDDELETGHSR